MKSIFLSYKTMSRRTLIKTTTAVFLVFLTITQFFIREKFGGIEHCYTPCPAIFNIQSSTFHNGTLMVYFLIVLVTLAISALLYYADDTKKESR